MKLAYVINSLEGGGAQSPIPELFRVLEEQGVEIKLYALSKRNGLAIPSLDAANISWCCYSGHKKQHVKAGRWLHKQLKADAPDIIWTSLTQATLIGQIMGLIHNTPVVSWQHNTFLKPANYALLRLTKSLSKLWVTDSQAVKDLMVKRLKLDPRKTVIWPLFFANSAAQQASPYKPNEIIRIASLGRLHPNKGYDILIKAIAKLKLSQKLPPFKINIAGQGAQKDSLETLKTVSGVTEINLVGHVSNPQDFLSHHHAYIQPSRHEGLGIAAHEAMQAGLPVLCSRVGQMALTNANPESGWLCNVEDVDSLAEALDNLLQNSESLTSYGKTIKATVLDKFSQKRFDIAGREFILRLEALTETSPENILLVKSS